MVAGFQLRNWRCERDGPLLDIEPLRRQHDRKAFLTFQKRNSACHNSPSDILLALAGTILFLHFAIANITGDYRIHWLDASDWDPFTSDPFRAETLVARPGIVIRTSRISPGETLSNNSTSGRSPLGFVLRMR